MPQDFSIPLNYQPPSASFHETVKHRLVHNRDTLTLLWGSPGRGKSTYLSFLVNQLSNEGHTILRHHYHLSATDQTQDRISFSDVAGSLIHQMRIQFGQTIGGLDDGAHHLHQWITACAELCHIDGRQLHLIVDGLDHVQREVGTIEQMSHLFNRLLPLPENVSLIIGTQRVSDDALPARLLQHASSQDWMEIPRMDSNAVHAWVANQRQANRLPLLHESRNQDDTEAIGAIAEAFFTISAGHPLHLIYSLESFVRQGTLFTTSAIEALPACPDGNIEHYYRGLWTRLSANGKRALHLIAGSDFPWPEAGLRQCAGAIDDMLFLMEPMRSGLVVFHGSISAFVRALPEHSDAFGALRPTVIDWLNSPRGPDHLRWGWLWLLQAEEGHPNTLLEGATHEWVAQSLIKGRPVDQIENILATAERVTFDARDYASTLDIRRLKIRLLNGTEFQTGDFQAFQYCALRQLEDVKQTDRLLDSLPTQPSTVVSMLAELAALERPDVLELCVTELRHRVNLWINYRHKPWREFVDLTQQLLRAQAYSMSIDTRRCVVFLEHFYDGYQLVHLLMNKLVYARRLDAVSEFVELWDERLELVPLSIAQDALSRLLGLEGVTSPVSERIRSERHSGLLNSLLYFKNITECKDTLLPEVPADFSKFHHATGGNEELAWLFHQIFFFYLAEYLQGHEPTTLCSEEPSPKWIQGTAKFLQDSARQIAATVRRPSFASLYVIADRVDVVSFSGRYRDDYAYYRSFHRALRNIAMDLHRLQSQGPGQQPIDINDLWLARQSKHWEESQWIACVLESPGITLNGDAVRSTLREAVLPLSHQVTQFDERADRWVEITRFAQCFGIPEADAYLERAAMCLLGYGYRKDLWLTEVLDGIQTVCAGGYQNGSRWLDRLYPICEQVTEFTDGDETNYIRTEMIQTIAKVDPDRLPPCYDYYIENDEHCYAEDVMSAYCAVVDLTHPVHRVLIGSLVERAPLKRLESIATTGNVDAQALLDQQLAMLGGMPLHRTDRHLTNNGSVIDDDPLDVSLFEPSHFPTLVQTVADRSQGYFRLSSILTTWLDHWVDQGQGREALTAARRFAMSETRLEDFDSFLDRVFEQSLAIEGSTAAYFWLVLAHSKRHGWQTLWSSEADIVKRLTAVRDYYPERWPEFIRDTANLPPFLHRVEGSFAIGYQYLIRLLVNVGELDQAVDIVERLVSIVEREVSEQPIPALKWF